jgi:hypothetical protein
MADFSKQWCDINDSEMSWDFDILEIAETITPGYNLCYVCEGFGFSFIGKDLDSNILLGFPNYDDSKITWKTYNEVING